jgi:hypothetical protein
VGRSFAGPRVVKVGQFDSERRARIIAFDRPAESVAPNTVAASIQIASRARLIGRGFVYDHPTLSAKRVTSSDSGQHPIDTGVRLSFY